MDRRGFGKVLLAGVAAMGNRPADALPSVRHAGDTPYRVLPDLKVRRLGDIHTGGDYHTLVGKGPTEPASLDYFRRFNARYLTVRARTNATAEEMRQWPHAGVFLNADGPWDGEELVRWQDNCRAADMVMEAVRMDSAYIIIQCLYHYEGRSPARAIFGLDPREYPKGRACGREARLLSLDHDPDTAQFHRAGSWQFRL